MAPDESAESSRDSFECDNCGYRVEAEHNPGDCPKCGGEMRNISRGREV